MTTPLFRGLPPVVDENAEVLILGSFPSVQSLAARQYYANPQNAFWPIASELFGFALTAPYEQRLAAIQAHGVALWDVLHECRRKGSSDSAFDPKTLVPNDFARLHAQYPVLKRGYLNGSKAAALYRRLVGPGQGVHYQRLPSTSSAHAIPRAVKLAAWRVIS